MTKCREYTCEHCKETFHTDEAPVGHWGAKVGDGGNAELCDDCFTKRAEMVGRMNIRQWVDFELRRTLQRADD